MREITDALYREFLIFVGADVVELLGVASCNLDKVVAIGGDRDSVYVQLPTTKFAFLSLKVDVFDDLLVLLTPTQRTCPG